MDVQSIAKVCHEINKAYCEAIGDHSQLHWEDAKQWQRNSAYDGVIYNIEHPNCLASDTHENWLKDKERDGWKYGPVKDVDKKEHPCFLPYDELPLEQRIKDHLFKAVVTQLKEL